MSPWLYIPIAVAGMLMLVFIYDILQRKSPILRIYPVVGHIRFMLMSVGPELRQYIVASNNEERPFSRDQRRWVYSSADKTNNYFGFGTDNDLERSSAHIIIKQSAFPVDENTADPLYPVPCKKVMGGARKREHAFTPQSIIYVSGMSYGSLGKTAVEAINRGCEIAKCLHNTGEGGVSPYHQRGGELVWQIGTGYFGCRDADGAFSLSALKEVIASSPIRALEIKLSQGAKPGLGGVLPKKKITAEIARIRGIPQGKDCLSPSSHTEFRSVDEMLDFVERIADETGLPVGLKSAVGDLGFWHDLAEHMESGKRGVDYIAIDGGEGGTGAAPLSFSDHVSMPFKIGFSRVHKIFAERGVSDSVVFTGAGKLGLPSEAMLAMALGCDMIGVAREAMLAIGCIQAQHCHSGKCPAGIATHSKWRVRGLDPSLKSVRLANYLINLRKEMLRLSNACGHSHPADVGIDHFEILDPEFNARAAKDVFAPV